MAKILIIEDDLLVNRMYQKIFSSRGYDVKAATDGQEGLEKIVSFKPTLVLMDIMMPKLNGLGLLRKLKAQPELAHIPVVVLTNLEGTTDAEEALSQGAVKYIVKSDYTPKEVFDIVKGILDGYTRNEVPEVKPPKA